MLTIDGFGLPHTLYAADPEEAPALSAVLEFRRERVPAEQLADFARGHLPIRESEFQQLLLDARRRTRQGGNGLVGCERAEYFARFENDALVEGRAKLQVRTDGAAALLWPWRDVSLPLRNARWEADPPRPAIVGLVGNATQAVLVEAPGTLVCDWSLRGQRVSRESVDFVWHPPSGAFQSLTLDLPSSLIPVCADAIVRQVAASATNNASAPAAAAPTLEPTPEVASGRRVFWQIQWQGDRELNVRLTLTSARRGHAPTVRVRQDLHYVVDARSLELQADLHLDVPGEPLREVVLMMDRRLRVGAVRLGDKPLPWSRRNGPEGAAYDEVFVAVPDLVGDDRWIQCTALAPVELGTSWTLPALQARDMLWLEGEAQITVQDPLMVSRIETRGGRLTGLVGAASDRRRSWRVRLQEPDAQCTVLADVPPTRLRIRSGTSLTADVGNLSARYIADVTSLSGALFVLEAELPRAWLVDDVESLSGPAFDDFQLVAGSAPTRQLLRIPLREPLAAGKLLRLNIRAHRAPPTPNTAVGIEQLRVVRFRDPGVVRHDVEHWVALSNAANTRVRFSGDQAVRWIDPEQVQEADEGLLDVSGGGRVFVADQAAETLEVRFERDRPRFRAEVDVAAVVRAERLTESYRVRLIPDDSALDRVPIYFSRARGVALQWQAEEPSDISPTFRKLAATSDGGTEGGETWEVVFPRPHAGPATLIAQRSIPLEDSANVSLVSLPEALEQRGRLNLAAGAATGRWINRGLRPITDVPSDEALAAAEQLAVAPGTVAFFEYEPTSGGAASIGWQREEPVGARVWASRAQLDTIAVPDGTLRHRWTYDLQNVSATEVTFGIGASTRLERMVIDGLERTPLDPEVREHETQREIRCALPTDRQSVRLELELSAQQPVFRLFHSLELPTLTTSFPVLEQHWRVALPRAWSVWNVVEPGKARPQEADFDATHLWPAADWRERLFGLVLRHDESSQRDHVASGWAVNSLANEDASADDSAALGWHDFELHVAPGSPLALRVCHAAVLRSTAWIALLITAALGGWIGRRWRSALPWLTLTTGLVALLLPAVVSEIGCGVFLGSLVAPLFTLGMRRPPKRPMPAGAGIEGTTMTAAIVTGLWLLTAWLPTWPEPGAGTATVHAQEPANEPDKGTNAARSIYRVLVPVDEQGAPAGDYVHVPREFYHALRRQAGRIDAAGAAAMLHAAHYQATLRAGDNPSLEVVADYEVLVRQPDAPISWPWARNAVTVLESRATLGGEVQELDWQTDDAAWSVVLPRVGEYRIRFRLHVPIPADANKLSVTVPAVPGAQLAIAASDGAARLRLANETLGGEEVDDDGLRRTLLGSTGRLRFQWEATDAPMLPTADYLYWLNVRPGSVQLDCALRLPPTTLRASRTVRLRHDPQLRLLPIAGSEVIVRAGPAPGIPGVLVLELAESDEPVEVRLSFLLSRATGVGRIVVPHLEWLDGRAERQWLAVTVAPSLELSRHEGASLEPLQVPVFLQAWGGTDSLPLAAYRLVSDGEPAVLAIRQREAEWTASEHTTYELRRNRGELTWTADVAVGVGPVFQYQVEQHGAVQLVDVALEDGPEHTPRPVRWSIDSQGTLQILAEQGVTGAHRLRVRGDFALLVDKEMTLPSLALRTRQPHARGLRVRRHESLLVDSITLPGWTVASSGDQRVRGKATLADEASIDWHDAGAWEWRPGEETEAGEPLVKLLANRPRIRGRVVIALRPGVERWQANVVGMVQADRGRVESLRCEVPPEWSLESEDEGGTAGWQERTIPGDAHRQLIRVVGRDAPAPFEFSMHGGLEFPRHERPHAPDIQLLDAASVERYLVLPTHDRGRKLIWETGGLRAVVQPDRWLSGAVAQAELATPPTKPEEAPAVPTEPVPADHVLYQIVSPRFQAVVVDLEEEALESRVLRQEAEARIWPNRAGWGTITFTTRSNARDCIVDLPQSVTLVEARVAGTLAVFEPLDDGGLRLPLPEEFDGHDIALVYQWTAREPSAKQTALTPPALRGWTAEVWTGRTIGRSHPESTERRSWLAAVVFAVVVTTGVGVVRWFPWRDLLARGPALPTVLLGVAWWLWFDPQWLGLVAAGVGILAANLPSTIRLGTKRAL